MMRSEEAEELNAKAPNAYLLAGTIARRARYTEGFNRHGLAPGEAFIGDFRNCGLTKREYRTAKQQLEKWGFAAFKPTNKGTVAKLLDRRLFDVRLAQGDEQNDTQAAGDRHTGGRQPTPMGSSFCIFAAV
jgi:hypothetical protein